MKHRPVSSNLPLLALFLALTRISLASNIWYVDGVNGSDANDCKSNQTACKTIGHGISLASAGDSITVAAATYHADGLVINISLKIRGSRSGSTIMDGGGIVINNGVGHSYVTLSNLTFRNCAVNNNGGALTINYSTIRGHAALYGGGVINQGGTLSINNSTISGNSAIRGGGIYNNGAGTLSINNSTISGNSADQLGGGIYNLRKTTVQNSIVSNNLAGNCGGGGVISNGYNLSSDDTCNFNNTGDLNNIDPKLGPLQRNGGPTQTMALLDGSPGIDMGNPSGCTDDQGRLLKTDQRGAPQTARILAGAT
jgi:hypothetical protein